METQFYYIHGLGGGKRSIKFLELEQKYPNIECLQWFVGDTISYRIRQWKKIIEKQNKKICIIASSTGANFAYQLQLESEFYTFDVVYINPLFDFKDVIYKNNFPDQIGRQTIEIKSLLTNSLVLLSENDEVLKQNNSVFLNNNQVVMCESSTHKFECLPKYFHKIDEYINRVHDCETTFIMYKQLQISYLKVELALENNRVNKQKSLMKVFKLSSYYIDRDLYLSKIIEKRFASIVSFYNEIQLNSNNLKFKEEVFRFLIKQDRFIQYVLNQAFTNRIKTLLKLRETTIIEKKNSSEINQKIKDLLKTNNSCLLDFL